ncbi:hypothetical protein K431DRAFT_282532 [Polychaeton citri CBS 116435]|uniref:DUF7907 domain-containing protein n=1 Tax=Polychaeton citri CBS 116435 TaxID=1314669 RepID=A0A9P4URE6_9PEZI|nr:hypothetical protein K431DRAFT_282532 [Polychaeton citri CBS 116435]
MKFAAALTTLLTAATSLAAPSSTTDLSKREITSLQSHSEGLTIHERAHLATLESRAAPTLNTSRSYLLHTSLKPHQPKKSRFNDLYLYSYHTGAGLGDAVLTPNSTVASKGFLNGTNITSPTGKKFYNQEFDLGGDFPWALVPAPYTIEYTAWQPVRINAGQGVVDEYSGFFINGTGLQWSTAPESEASRNLFGGWIVCEWWHPDIGTTAGPAPQLFFRWNYASTIKLPSSCADVNLVPEYI